jgi:hypothetical protein
MKPDDDRQRAGRLAGRIKIKSKGSAVDAFVDQISLDFRIRDLWWAWPCPDRLSGQRPHDGRGDYGS